MSIVKYYNLGEIVGQPTIPVKKTIEGVRAGKDEFLQKAIEVTNNANK